MNESQLNNAIAAAALIAMSKLKCADKIFTLCSLLNWISFSFYVLLWAMMGGRCDWNSSEHFADRQRKSIVIERKRDFGWTINPTVVDITVILYICSGSVRSRLVVTFVMAVLFANLCAHRLRLVNKAIFDDSIVNIWTLTESTSFSYSTWNPLESHKPIEWDDEPHAVVVMVVVVHKGNLITLDNSSGWHETAIMMLMMLTSKCVSNLFDAKVFSGITTTKWNTLTANEAWKMLKHKLRVNKWPKMQFFGLIWMEWSTVIV